MYQVSQDQDGAGDESQTLGRFRTFTVIAYTALVMFAVSLLSFISPTKALEIHLGLCAELSEIKRKHDVRD